VLELQLQAPGLGTLFQIGHFPMGLYSQGWLVEFYTNMDIGLSLERLGF
jgi:hypothetical protein